jgi:hypothetical protein
LGWLTPLARLEPDEAEKRFRKLSGHPNHDVLLMRTAAELAIDRPADAERFFNLREESDLDYDCYFHVLQICRRLARIDPARARRIATSLAGPGRRACAWAFVAHGVAGRNLPAAREAIDRAIEAIDQVRAPGSKPERIAMAIANAPRRAEMTNVAATILPIVEQVAPDRLADVFWRAVDLCTRLELGHEDESAETSFGNECTLMARCDPQATAILFAPMDAYLRRVVANASRGPRIPLGLLCAELCLNRRAVVAMVESFPPARTLSPDEPANDARLVMVGALGRPEERWQSVYAMIDILGALDD